MSPEPRTIIPIDPNMSKADGTIPVRYTHIAAGAKVGDPVIAVEEEGGDYWDATIAALGERIAYLKVDWKTHRETEE